MPVSTRFLLVNFYGCCYWGNCPHLHCLSVTYLEANTCRPFMFTESITRDRESHPFSATNYVKITSWANISKLNISNDLFTYYFTPLIAHK